MRTVLSASLILSPSCWLACYFSLPMMWVCSVFGKLRVKYPSILIYDRPCFNAVVRHTQAKMKKETKLWNETQVWRRAEVLWCNAKTLLLHPVYSQLAKSAVTEAEDMWSISQGRPDSIHTLHQGIAMLMLNPPSKDHIGTDTHNSLSGWWIIKN